MLAGSEWPEWEEIMTMDDDEWEEIRNYFLQKKIFFGCLNFFPLCNSCLNFFPPPGGVFGRIYTPALPSAASADALPLGV